MRGITKIKKGGREGEEEKEEKERLSFLSFFTNENWRLWEIQLEPQIWRSASNGLEECLLTLDFDISFLVLYKFSVY